MSWTDWTRSDERPSAVAILTTSGLIAGTTSLSLRAIDFNAWFAPGMKQPIMAVTSGANTTTGKIRTLFRPTSIVGTTIDMILFGFSQNSTGTGSSYQCWFSNNGSGGTDITRIRFTKDTTIRATTNITAIPLNTVFAAEFEWQQDQNSTSQVLLTARLGSQTDFSDLGDIVTTKYLVTDNTWTSALTAGVTVRCEFGQGGHSAECRVDNTKMSKP